MSDPIIGTMTIVGMLEGQPLCVSVALQRRADGWGLLSAGVTGDTDPDNHTQATMLAPDILDKVVHVLAAASEESIALHPIAKLEGSGLAD